MSYNAPYKFKNYFINTLLGRGGDLYQDFCEIVLLLNSAVYFIFLDCSLGGKHPELRVTERKLRACGENRTSGFEKEVRDANVHIDFNLQESYQLEE